MLKIGERAGDDPRSRRRLIVSGLVSIAMHAGFLGTLAYSHVGEPSHLDGETPVVLSARLVRSEAPVDVDNSGPEGAITEKLLDAEPAALAVAEQGRFGVEADGASRQPSGIAGLSAGETRSATVTREVTPTYYAADVLGRRPIPLHPVAPKYPEGTDDLTGMVRLVLFINEKGGVDHVKVLFSELPAAFEMASVAAFSAARYAPGLIADRPVKAKFVVEVTFDLTREAVVAPQK